MRTGAAERRRKPWLASFVALTALTSSFLITMTPGHAAAANGAQPEPNDDIGMVIQATYNDCPDSWVCLFDWRDWNADHPNARMWKFQDVTAGYQNLANWSANNKAASWRNRRDFRTWLRRSLGGGDYDYKCLEGRSQDSLMNPPWRDTADGIRNVLNPLPCDP
jgi:hypothetical protein